MVVKERSRKERACGDKNKGDATFGSFLLRKEGLESNLEKGMYCWKFLRSSECCNWRFLFGYKPTIIWLIL